MRATLKGIRVKLRQMICIHGPKKWVHHDAAIKTHEYPKGEFAIEVCERCGKITNRAYWV